MNPSEHRLRAVFSEALGIESPSARAEFLARACEGDPRLRGEVEELLEAEQSAGSFLPELPRMAGIGAALSQAAERTSKAEKGLVPQEPEGLEDKIGRYKLLQKIGEGGCGVVYMAEQLEPVRRKVALKIIKLGMDTRPRYR